MKSVLPNDFLTVREAAAAFRSLLRSEGVLRRMVAAGKVRVWRPAGRLMFSRAQLAEDLAALECGRSGRWGAPAAAPRPMVFHNPRLAGALKVAR